MRRSTLSIFMVLGIALTAFDTYVLAATVGGTEMYFFQQYFSPTRILASVMVFLLLLTIKPPSIQKEPSPSKSNKLVKIISQNTLAIFLFHVIVLESLQNGYFGLPLTVTH
jgi:surface polysaccharide O-acyltransferase-like enzyme